MRFFASLGALCALARTRKSGRDSPTPPHAGPPWAHPPPAFILCGLLSPGVPAVTPRLLLLACVLVLAAGCGQKGPLYLPEEPQDESAEESTE